MSLLKSLLYAARGKKETEAGTGGLVRLTAAKQPDVLYAIGDIHGCLDQLLALEAQIVADAARVDGERWLIYLGDYVDRGPKSAQVLDHILAPPPEGFRRVCLRGNHEAMMLAAIRNPAALDDWLAFGGEETMSSYGVSESQLAGARGRSRMQILQAHIPDEHIELLDGLPVAFSLPGYTFVHAGLRPGVPLAEQRDGDLMWIRDEFIHTAHDYGAVIVHGHTPVREPQTLPHRIAVDTGCYQSGHLTALRLTADGSVSFLST